MPRKIDLAGKGNRRIILRSFLGIFLVGFGLAIWGFVIEPSRLVVRKINLFVPRWPKALDGLQALVVADLHVGSPFWSTPRIIDLVKQMNDLNPDIILLLGDYVIHDVLGGEFVDPEEIGRALAGCSAPLGVWAILGNHDHWLDGPRMRKALESNGIRVLENNAAILNYHDEKFALVGLGDYWTTKPDYPKALPKSVRDLPILAMTHNPDIFPGVPKSVNLTLAGHTHGGQVNIPFLGRRVVPSEFGDRYAYGEVIE